MRRCGECEHFREHEEAAERVGCVAMPQWVYQLDLAYEEFPFNKTDSELLLEARGYIWADTNADECECYKRRKDKP